MNHEVSVNHIKDKTKTSYSTHIVYILLLIILGGLSYYLYDMNKKYMAENTSVKYEIAQLKANLAELNDEYVSTVNKMEMSEKDKLFLIGNLNAVMSDYSGLQQNYNTKIQEVDTLTKQVYIDPELLKKYSKYYFLNENYTPSSTATISPAFTLNSKEIPILTEVKPKLESMLIDAKNQNINLIVYSGYRSFKEQQGLKGIYVQKYGTTKSNQFSADQGYSEHQLGTTVDVSDVSSGLVEKFDKTAAFIWLQNNAYRYGFILSYNKNNPYYTYEPWHWRYVGVELATYMYNNNLNFYDMDQNKIDEYKVKIFD